MKAFIAIAIILLASCEGCWLTGRKAATEFNDYQIYSLVLDQRARRSDGSLREQLTILGTTTSPPESFPSEAAIEGEKLMTPALKMALDDFELKNRTSITLQDKFARSGVTLISVEDEPTLFNLIKLSQVGYSKDKGTAIVYSIHTCGPLCGGSDYFLFAQENGRWKITKVLNGVKF